MAPANSQNTRLGKLFAPPGAGSLFLLGFSGSERINDLFEFRVTALVEGGRADLDSLLGQNVCVEVDTVALTKRYINGMVIGAHYLGVEPKPEAHFYELQLRPWFWLLGQRQNSRIFHDLSPTDIIKKVLGDYGGAEGSEYRFQLNGTYPTLEYTVQYRETDLDFVRRLLEEYGINFHFDMREDGHILMMSDSADAFEPLPEVSRIYKPVMRQNVSSDEHFSEWLPRRVVTTGAVRLMDYDFKRPALNLEAREERPLGYGHSELESYDYPGNHLSQTEGRQLARRRVEAFRSGDTVYDAQGDVLCLAAGMKVTLTEHPDDDMNAEYICTGMTHDFRTEAYRSGPGSGRGGSGEGYRATYTLIRSSVPIAPAMRTPPGQVRGPQTARVIGEGEIDCDEHGRILVHFHWDDASAGSMRCRVQQSWAGNGWGSMFIPRVGMEVVVEFLEGNPDRPLVTGTVYNGANKPAHAMPANKTISGLKTNSVGGSGFNGITFEDKAGAELIDVHGQMDMKVVIERDENASFGRHVTKQVGVNSTEQVGNNANLSIGAGRTTTVGADDTLSVGANRTTTVGSNDSLDVGAVLQIVAGQKIELVVGGSSIIIEDGSISITSRDVDVTAAAGLTTTAGATADHTAGGIMKIIGALVKING